MDWIATNSQTLLYSVGTPLATAIVTAFFVYKIAPKISHRLEIKRTDEVPFQKWAAEACGEISELHRRLIDLPNQYSTCQLNFGFMELHRVLDDILR